MMPNETNESAYRTHVATMDREQEARDAVVEERALAMAQVLAGVAHAMVSLERQMNGAASEEDVQRIQAWALRSPRLEPIADYLQDEVFFPVLRE